MKRQVNFMVKLLVMLTLTLQLMPFSVIAETLAQSPATATMTENKAVTDQLTGQALETYLESLTEEEREAVQASLSEAQLASLQEVVASQSTTASQAVEESSTVPAERPLSSETVPTGEASSEASDVLSTSESVTASDVDPESVPYVGAEVNYLQAGPLVSPLAQDATSNLVLNKTATYNAEANAVDFQLEAYAKGEQIVSANQVDVVFVLDVSTSMNDPLGSTTRKLAALKTAVKNFADAMVVSQSKLTAGQYHTMRVVTYSNRATTDPMTYRTSVTNNVTSFKDKITNLTTSDYTRQDLGLANAQTVVTSNKAVPNRTANQVVILFTDGEPFGTNKVTKDDIARGAVTTANSLKNSLGATVYSVGIQNAANPVGTDLPNKMLTAISNNYPAATVSSSGSFLASLVLGARAAGDYYLTTNNADGLESIFQSIATEIGKIDNLTIRDVLSPELFLPNLGSVPDFSTVEIYKAWTYSKSLSPLSKANVTYDAAAKALNFSNVTLDPVIFTGSVPTEATKNNKLIIRFQAKVAPDFMGGNQVITNEAPSGAYTTANGVETMVQAFSRPTVNIPLKDANLAVKDQKIYLGNATQIGNFFTNIGLLNGVNNSYAKVTYSISQNGAVLSKKIIQAGEQFQDEAFDSIKTADSDTIYQVRYEIEAALPAPTGTTGVTKIDKTSEAKIYVFTPVVKVPDRKIYLTNALEPTSQLPTITDWEHPNKASLTSLPFGGTAPTITKGTYGDITALTSERNTGLLQTVTLSNAKGVTVNQPFTVYVFRPVISSTNTTIELGQSSHTSDRYQSVKWQNSLVSTTGLEGTEPQLALSAFELGGSATKQETVSPMEPTDYYWKVSANNQDISQFTSYTNSTYLAGQQPTGAHFTIYVKASSLLIKKTIVADGPRSFGEETFLFEITWENGDNSETYYEAITLTASQQLGEVRLSQLKAGSYTIKEVTDWSSRYEVDGQVKKVQITSATPGSANFKNTLKKSNWLSYESKVVNQFTPYSKKVDEPR